MNLDNYPGAKSGSGVVQWLINNIPYHERYFELFAGSAQLYKAKKPANLSVLSDINPDVVNELLKQFTASVGCEQYIWNESFFKLLNEIWFKALTKKDFIYLDPPYPKKARRSGKKYYEFEMLEETDHVQLLNTIRTLPANIMISTRQNDLYDIMLEGWRKETFQTVDRGGIAEEIIFMNYPVPALLHQYDYVGHGFSDRQRIKRKVDRFFSKISMLPDYEKHLFIQQLIKEDTPAVKHFLTMAAAMK